MVLEIPMAGAKYNGRIIYVLKLNLSRILIKKLNETIIKILRVTERADEITRYTAWPAGKVADGTDPSVVNPALLAVHTLRRWRAGKSRHRVPLPKGAPITVCQEPFATLV